MAGFDSAVLTKKGIALLTKVGTGVCKLTITKAASGSGIYQGEDISDLTALINQQQTFNIKSMKRVNDKYIFAQFTVSNNPDDGEALTTGYTLRELGIFAQDPDEGEILYSVTRTEEDKGDYIPPYSGYIVSEIDVDYLTEVANADDVTIITVDSNHSADGTSYDNTNSGLDASSVQAAIDELKELIGQGIGTATATMVSVTIPADGWTKGASEAPSDWLYKDVAVEKILSDSVPVISIYPPYSDIATECGLKSMVKAMEGYVRFYADSAPASAITADLCWIDGAAVDSDRTYTPPIASESVLGGVKIGPGVSVSSDGTISVNVYVLPTAASETTGGVRADTKASTDTVPARIGTDKKLYVPTYPTKLPASDVYSWAKAATKPAYTASEVGALPDTTEVPTKLSELEEDATHRTVTDEQTAAWDAKSDFSGDYNDLENQPTIPVVPTETIAANAEARHTHSNKTVLDGISSTKVAAWDAKSDFSGSYTDLTDKPDIDGKISTHNTSTAAHNDIRLLITALTNRLNTLADSDDETLDQMSEVVAYIKSNKELIEGITTSKVSVADIVDDLVTAVSDKPLSANQGVELKKLIDAIKVLTKLSEMEDDATHRTVTDTEKATWNAKSNFSGSYNDLSDAPTSDINANTEARHTHDNKTVLDGITADKVAAWDAGSGSGFSGNYEDLTNKPDLTQKMDVIKDADGNTYSLSVEDGLLVITQATDVTATTDA